jgi:pimeloyl-ACP methyl ester carboxylesterase
MERTKEPLVLISGHLCDMRLWMNQILDLTPLVSAVHVITPGPHETVAALADETEQRLPSGSFALAGFSLGGMVALDLMARMPERISRLALIDTTARPAPLKEHELAGRTISKAEAGDLEAVVAKFITFLHAPASRAAHPNLVPDTMTMMLSRAEACYVPQQKAMRDRLDRREELARIACPTLVLCGELDLVTPVALHEEMACLIPDATLTVIPGVGHMITQEAPAATSAALRNWLIDA